MNAFHSAYMQCAAIEHLKSFLLGKQSAKMLKFQQKEGVVRLYEGVEKKNKMIKQMKGTSMNLAEIESMWKYFDARLATF